MSVSVDGLISLIISTEESIPGTASIEPLLVEVLEQIESHADDRECYVRRLLALILEPAQGELILGEPGIVELLEFCMHELRWPEIRSALASLDVDGTDWRVRRSAQRVLDAHNDAWENAEIYAKYR
ncbi:hypothetical protein [Cellulomonas chengniuliangii]|uniref:hypothetical protein n=1 Tax=Cellulomonas chengniuliangii TaxID=2968084 RepID=UPI001D0DECA2|nr:hypothetical protein [Cellulomonas chengniuliangii]MCC2317036.1 hypothetical protein [Cellulomonas chengniuliangii]